MIFYYNSPSLFLKSAFHTTRRFLLLLQVSFGIKKETEQTITIKWIFFIFYKLDYNLQQSSKMDLKFVKWGHAELIA
jgi:hypothetical protein